MTGKYILSLLSTHEKYHRTFREKEKRKIK